MRRPHVMIGGVQPDRMAVSSRKLSALDQHVSELVNFDEGGLWTPTDPIVIGGKGMELGTASEVHGGVITKPKYGSADPRIELTDQWPTFSAARTRKVCVAWGKSMGAGTQAVFINSRGSVVQTGPAASSGVNLGMILDGRYIHDNATLTKATFSFRYSGAKPSSYTVEVVSIVRYRRSDNVNDVTLHTAGTVSGITYTGNSASRNVATLEAFYNGGNVINLEYTPDQNNTMSKSTHYYGFGLVTFRETEAISLQLEYSVSDQRFE
jgi:hypothetical protein